MDLFDIEGNMMEPNGTAVYAFGLGLHVFGEIEQFERCILRFDKYHSARESHAGAKGSAWFELPLFPHLQTQYVLVEIDGPVDVADDDSYMLYAGNHLTFPPIGI